MSIPLSQEQTKFLSNFLTSQAHLLPPEFQNLPNLFQTPSTEPPSSYSPAEPDRNHSQQESSQSEPSDPDEEEIARLLQERSYHERELARLDLELAEQGLSEEEVSLGEWSRPSSRASTTGYRPGVDSDDEIPHLHNFSGTLGPDSNSSDLEDFDVSPLKDFTLEENFSNFEGGFEQLCEADDFSAQVDAWLEEQVESLEKSPSESSSHYTNHFSTFRKRRYSRIEQGDDPKIPRDGSAEPEGDKSCNRNGKKVKKNKVAILGATDLGDLEEGDDLSVTAEGQQWVAADVPAPPPLPVQNATTTLLLDFIGGETSVGSSGCALQIENLQVAVAVAPWKDQDSLSCNTLVNLSHRLLRAEALDVGLTFTRMINELMFAAKINSILHL
ncbi:hypothetical protein F5050DRAFT_1818519, partial [Lentinula boryana]